jgi:NAD(P)-dependent dehydrogenase (short-subunit alcohol dehydrogenase family)
MRRILEGRTAVVTGAGRGLGREHARALAAAGANVVVNDYGGSDRGEGSDEAVAEAVVAEIRALGGSAVANTASVGDWDQARSIVDDAIEAFGDVDIVVNNAGIARFAATEAMSRQDWELMIAVNLTGTAAVSHWAASHWAAQGPRAGRAIINTSSPAGTNPAVGSPGYCASKAGVAAFTISAAAELAPLGVRVNAIAPMARSRMTLAVPVLEEIMKPVEQGFDRVAPRHVSPLVVWLASDHCRFTGRVFGIEGDDLFLFEGWSAEHRFNNGHESWSVESLSRVLSDVDRQDRGYMIAPSFHGRGAAPSDETLAALAEVQAGGANGPTEDPHEA